MKRMSFVLCAALVAAPAAWAQFTRGNDFVASKLAAFADVNGDGRADIVDANTIRLSNGDGTFGPDVRVVPDGQQTIAVLDFNGDGKPDLMTIDVFQSYPPQFEQPQHPQAQLHFYANNGQGGFTQVSTMFAGGAPYVVDFDGDGKDDILMIASTNADNVYTTHALFLRSNGNGTFTQTDDKAYAGSVLTSAADSGLGLHVAVGDLDNDHHRDVVLRGDDYFVFLFGRGDGTFDLTKRFAPAGAGGGGLQVADVDGDGNADMIFNSQAGIVVMYGNGAGRFPRMTTFTDIEGLDVGGTSRNYTLGHFLSSKPEIALVNASGKLLILSGEGGTLKLKATYATGLMNADVQHGAFRTSGIDDLYVYGQPSATTWQPLLLLSPPHTAATIDPSVPLRRHGRASQASTQQQFTVSMSGDCTSFFDHWLLSREGIFVDEISGGMGRIVELAYFDGAYHFRMTPDGSVPGIPSVEVGMFTDTGSQHFVGGGYGTDSCGTRVIYDMRFK